MLRRGFSSWIALLSALPVVDSAAGQTNSKTHKSTASPRYYRIVNGGSGNAVTIPDGQTNDEDGAVQSAVVATHDGQHWEFQRGRAGGWFRIVNRKTKKVLTVVGDAKSNGAAVAQWTENKRAAVQLWKRVPVDRKRTYYWLVNGHAGDGWFRLINAATSEALGVNGSSRSNGAAVNQSASKSTAAHQLWKLVPLK